MRSGKDYERAFQNLNRERQELQSARRLGQPIDEKRLTYLLAWMDVFGCADAFMRGELWTTTQAPKVQEFGKP